MKIEEQKKAVRSGYDMDIIPSDLATFGSDAKNLLQDLQMCIRDRGNALLWRKAWADISNAYLERAGSPERIDHRSNAERGIDELPTVHMGVAACQMEKKGDVYKRQCYDRGF